MEGTRLVPKETRLARELKQRRQDIKKRRARIQRKRAEGKRPARLVRYQRRVRARARKVRAALMALRRAKRQPLRLRALAEAEQMLGTMERGANNRGPVVDKITRYAGGVLGEPWCVNFVIWAYGRAGSKYVKPGFTRAVRYMYPAPGVVRVAKPLPGDIVRFTFDHTGVFVRDLGNGEIETIEGNTGATGAVSDSRHGGDGVYRKRRAKHLVQDYLRVKG